MSYISNTTINNKTPVSVKDYNVKGDGLTDDSAILHSIFATQTDVVYPVGTYLIDSDITVGSHFATHRFLRGATFYVNTGKILTISGQIVAEPDQLVFDGPGTVIFEDGSTKKVYVGWFGALGNGSDDDAPGIVKASSIALTTGSTVHFHRPPAGYFYINSYMEIGSNIISEQGITWTFDAKPYDPAPSATFAAGTGLASDHGRPMLLVQNIIRFEIDGAGFDANGQADYCIQWKNDPTSGWISWSGELKNVTLRRAKLFNLLVGNAIIEPAFNATTGVFTCTGHPFSNDTQVYLTPVLKTSAIPSHFSQDIIYYVVEKTSDTFKLSLTSGGSAITGGNTGVSRWLVCQQSHLGDASSFKADHCIFGTDDIDAGAVAHAAFIGTQTLGCNIDSTWLVGNMLLPVSITCNHLTNTITHDGYEDDDGYSHRFKNGDIVLVWHEIDNVDSLPPGLSIDTEYYVTNYNAFTKTMQLTATPGGSVVSFGGSNGVGDLLMTRLTYPYYGLWLTEGGVSVNSCISGSLYSDIRIFGSPAGQGIHLSVNHHDSQSWRYLWADNNTSTVPALGGVTLTGVTHSDIYGGSLRSIDWDMNFFSSLVVNGGTFYKNIHIGNNNNVPVVLNGPLLIPGLYVARVTGNDNQIDGSTWSEAAEPKSRYQNITLSGSINSTGSGLTLGNATRELFTLTSGGDGTISVLELGDSQQAILINASLDGYGNVPSQLSFIELKAGAGTDVLNGIFLDADIFRFRGANQIDNLTITNPGGNSTKLTTAGTTFSIGVSGADNLNITLGKIAIASGAGTLLIDASAGATGYLGLIAKSGQSIYYDADAHTIRTAAHTSNMTLSLGTANRGVITADLGILSLNAIAGIELNANSGLVTYFAINSSGDISWGSNTATQLNIHQPVVPGTGANAGVATYITAQAGQQQTGVNDNNSGGAFIIASGAPGTGGSGADGADGEIQFIVGGSGHLLTITHYPGLSYITLIETGASASDLFFEAGSGVGLIAFLGTPIQFAGLTEVVDNTGSGVWTWTNDHEDDNEMIIGSGVTSVTIRQDDPLDADTTGASWTIQPQKGTNSGDGGTLFLLAGDAHVGGEGDPGGTPGDVEINNNRGAYFRLTGDGDFESNLVHCTLDASSTFTISAGATTITGTSMSLHNTSGSMSISNTGTTADLIISTTDELTLSGTNVFYLKANGSILMQGNSTGIAFNGQSPIARPDYTVTNGSTDRSLNVTGDTAAQIAAVLGTLISDLISYGILQ